MIKTPFVTNGIARPSRGRFLKFWMFSKADDFLRKMCMSTVATMDFSVVATPKLIVAGPNRWVSSIGHMFDVV